MSDSRAQSDSDQTIALSQLSDRKMKKLLNIECSSRFLDQIFKNEKHTPTELLSDVYDLLVKKVSAHRCGMYYPHWLLFARVETLLEGVNGYFIQKYKLEMDELEIQVEPELAWIFQGVKIRDRMDFAVVRNCPNTGQVSHCVIVTCEENGVTMHRCAAYLRGLQELQEEKMVNFLFFFSLN